jgi:hypothetical protein
VSGVSFPPRSDRGPEIAALVEMLASAIPGRTAVYVAVPITSGRRFADWFPRRGPGVEPGTPAYRAEHDRHVVGPNCAAAAAEVRRLRAVFPGVVLDPTAVALAGWEQQDYHTLWATVIGRYAGTVVFLDGWAYSVGCAYEFLTALRTGAVTLAAGLTPLSAADGTAALRDAVGALRARGIPTGFHEAVLAELSGPREATGA